MDKPKGRAMTLVGRSPGAEAAGARSTASGTVNRRGAVRVGTGHNAVCRIKSVRYVVEVNDVSRSGARLRVRRGLVPQVGQSIQLSFMEREGIEAEVMWSQGSFAGVRFKQPLEDLSDAVHFDDLGAGYFRAILRFQCADE